MQYHYIYMIRNFLFQIKVRKNKINKNKFYMQIHSKILFK